MATAIVGMAQGRVTSARRMPRPVRAWSSRSASGTATRTSTATEPTLMTRVFQRAGREGGPLEPVEVVEESGVGLLATKLWQMT